MWPFRKKKSASQVNIEIHMREHEEFSKWAADKAHQAEVKRVEAQLTKTWNSILLVRPELAKEEEAIFNMAYYYDGDLWRTVKEWDKRIRDQACSEYEHKLRWEFLRQCSDARMNPQHPVAVAAWKEFYVPLLEEDMKHKKIEQELDDLRDAIEVERAEHVDRLFNAQMVAQDWKNKYDGQSRTLATLQDERDSWKIKAKQESSIADARIPIIKQLEAEVERVTGQLATQAQTIWSYDEQLRIETSRAFNRGAEWQKRQSEPAPKICFPTEHGFEVPDEYLTTLENAQREVKSVRAAFSLANKKLAQKEATITSLKTRNRNQADMLTHIKNMSKGAIIPTRLRKAIDGEDIPRYRQFDEV